MTHIFVTEEIRYIFSEYECINHFHKKNQCRPMGFGLAYLIRLGLRLHIYVKISWLSLVWIMAVRQFGAQQCWLFSKTQWNDIHLKFCQNSSCCILAKILHYDDVTWTSCHAVPNHRSFKCLFNSLCVPTPEKHQSPHYWPFVRGIVCPVNSPHKGLVTQKKLPFDNVIASSVGLPTSWFRERWGEPSVVQTGIFWKN